MSATRSTAATKTRPTPPGPANPIGSTIGFQRAPLELLERLISRYGDVCSFRLGTTRIVLLSHPRDVKRVLQQNAKNYDRSSTAHKMARTLFGDGLATSVGGESWRRHRRLMQPSFHYQRVAAMSEHMLAEIRSTLDNWERLAPAQEPINANDEMRRLTLRIVARALFGLQDEEVLLRFGNAVDTMDHELAAYVQLPFVPLSVPTAGHRRFWSGMRAIEEILDDTISRHLDERVDRGDLLSMLIETKDEDTGERLTNRQLRDEVFVMLFAGHETSANVLTWVWYRLGLHPDVQKRVQQEVDHELGGQPPTLADCSKLAYTRCVIEETMRLYPQVSLGWRRAIEEDELGGYRIPAGTDVTYSTYHMHRHPDYWDDPESFQPDRFAPEQAERRDRSAYIPFGAGPHLCIGNQFAMTEMLLIIASTIQRFRLELTSTTTIAPKPLITLGPERTVPIRLEPRT